MLLTLQQQLTTGDIGKADGLLSSASTALSPVARSEIDAARTAIANNDIANARWHLWQAISDAQSSR